MIVSTDYPEAHSYGDRIQIAADADEMVKDIRNCLAHPMTPQGRQRLRESVVDQTWDERTQRLADYVDDLVRDRTKPATDVAPPARIDRDSVRS